MRNGPGNPRFVFRSAKVFARSSFSSFFFLNFEEVIDSELFLTKERTDESFDFQFILLLHDASWNPRTLSSNIVDEEIAQATSDKIND